MSRLPPRFMRSSIGAAGMLIGNIEVLAEPFFFGNQSDQFVGNHIRIAVQKTHPLQSIDLQQARAASVVMPFARPRSLPYAIVSCETMTSSRTPCSARRRDSATRSVNRAAAEPAAKARELRRTCRRDRSLRKFSDTPCTTASSGFAESSELLSRCTARRSRHPELDRGIQLNRFENSSKLIGTEDEIDFRNFFLDLAAIALRQAAGDDEFLAVAVRLQFRHFQNRIDGFLSWRCR